MIIKKYIYYPSTEIYAIFYHEDKVIYYNLNFSQATKLIIFK